MISHPFPDGSLVKTYGRPNDKTLTYGIVEGYVRDYNPCDSFYFILIDNRIQARNRRDVWLVNQ
mgnify:CR=1 FL=1